MSELWVCVGDYMNTLERVAPANITTSPSWDANWPITNLYDRLVSMGSRPGSLAANIAITVDANIVLNGSMESVTSGSILSNWTITGAGTAVQSNTQHHSGSFSMLLTGVVVASQTFLVRNGERFTFSAFGWGDTTHAASVYLKNQITGNYFKPGGGWQAAKIAFLANTAASWSGNTIVGNIEDVWPLGPDLMTMLLTIEGASGGVVFADDVYYWPSHDHTSMHGMLNMEYGLVPELDSSTDGITFGQESVVTNQVPVMWYSPITPIDKRWLRWQLTGTPNINKPFGGELIFTQKRILNVGAAQGAGGKAKMVVKFVSTQNRLATGYGDQRAQPLSGWPQRDIDLSQFFSNENDKNEFRDRVFLRSGGGVIPMILMPYVTDAQNFTDPDRICSFGYMTNTWQYEAGPNIQISRNANFHHVELPFPIFVQ